MFRTLFTPAAPCVALLLVSGAAVAGSETAASPGDAGSTGRRADRGHPTGRCRTGGC